jgi:Zn-dependent M32 family carboxypeptidase
VDQVVDEKIDQIVEEMKEKIEREDDSLQTIDSDPEVIREVSPQFDVEEKIEEESEEENAAADEKSQKPESEQHEDDDDVEKRNVGDRTVDTSRDSVDTVPTRQVCYKPLFYVSFNYLVLPTK